VLLGLVLAIGASQRAHDRDDGLARQRARADLARLQGGIDLAAARTSTIAAAAALDPAAFRSAALSVPAAMLVEPSSGAIVARTGTVPGRRSEAVAAAAAASAVRLVGPDRAGQIVAAAPVIPPNTPSDIASRRAATTAVAVTAVQLSGLLHPAGQTALFPDADVRVGPAGPSIEHPLLRGQLDLVGTVVPVAILPRERGPRTLIGWGILSAAVLVALAGYLVLSRQQERRRRAEAEASERAHQLEMIAVTSSSLQQSLELADLLPTFCVTLAEHYELACVSVEIADEEGHRVEAFRYGDEGGGTVRQRFDLRRGWRTVGALELGGTTELDEFTVQSLQAMCDLLAVAVSNAQLFQREQQAATRLRELDALKNAFLGTVSHELRTSTTAVQGFGDLLTDHWDTLPEDRRRELAARIRRQAGSLRHLVDDLLDYARLEHERLRVEPRSLVLGEVVSQLVDSMTPVVGDHVLDVDVEPGVEAWADPIAVERILANLLSNAGKYSPPGTTVSVGVSRVGDRARLCVADQGPGIPAEERRRVFVRFYRLDNPETVRTRGAGIGLSILHDFADRSGAPVTIDDAPGGGARICVDFPIRALEDVTA
jgi:signal transduction histidine kinase